MQISRRWDKNSLFANELIGFQEGSRRKKTYKKCATHLCLKQIKSKQLNRQETKFKFFSHHVLKNIDMEYVFFKMIILMQTNKNSNLFLTMGKAFKKSGELNDVKCFKLKIYDHQKSGLKFLVF